MRTQHAPYSPNYLQGHETRQYNDRLLGSHQTYRLRILEATKWKKQLPHKDKLRHYRLHSARDLARPDDWILLSDRYLEFWNHACRAPVRVSTRWMQETVYNHLNVVIDRFRFKKRRTRWKFRSKFWRVRFSSARRGLIWSLVTFYPRYLRATPQCALPLTR